MDVIQIYLAIRILCYLHTFTNDNKDFIITFLYFFVKGFGSEATTLLALAFIRNYYAAFVLLVIGEGLAGFAMAGMTMYTRTENLLYKNGKAK